MKNRMVNGIVIGEIGKGHKTIVMKEVEFEEQYAPKDAIIERFAEKGENYVRMTYNV